MEGILVDELEHEPSDHQQKEPRKCLNDHTNENLEVTDEESSNLNFKEIIIDEEPSDLNFKDIIIDECEPKNNLRKNKKYPENYRTCVNFFKLLRELVSFINIFRSFWNWVLAGM